MKHKKDENNSEKKEWQKQKNRIVITVISITVQISKHSCVSQTLLVLIPKIDQEKGNNRSDATSNIAIQMVMRYWHDRLIDPDSLL